LLALAVFIQLASEMVAQVHLTPLLLPLKVADQIGQVLVLEVLAVLFYMVRVVLAVLAVVIQLEALLI
jgi:hypothetical protein